MKSKIYIFVLIMFVLALPKSIKAQNMLLHYMNDLPQSRLTNVANQPDFRFTMGFPGISNTQLSLISSSTIMEVFSPEMNNTYVFNVGDVVENMRTKNIRTI